MERYFNAQRFFLLKSIDNSFPFSNKMSSVLDKTCLGLSDLTSQNCLIAMLVDSGFALYICSVYMCKHLKLMENRSNR